MSDFVNKGKLVKKNYSDMNCALCSVAAVFGTNTYRLSELLGLNGHQPEESFALAYMKKNKITAEPNMAPGKQLEYAIDGIKEFVSALKSHMQTPTNWSQGGSWETLVPMKTQIATMKTFPVSTQFVVWACLADMKGLGAHWNYAVRTEEGLEFRDYQYNDAKDHPPKVSDKFIAPRGNPTEKYKQGIFIAFRSKDLKLV